MRRASRHAGFTLIELVLVILVMAIGFVSLSALYVQVTDTLGSNEDLQTSAQLAQGCAEHVLATRRNLGFDSAAINANICNGLPIVVGYIRAVVPSGTYVGGPATACPNGQTCRDVTVTVSRGAINTPIQLLLVR